MDPTQPAIAIRNARKAFGATVALDDASFEVAPGTVHALLGENGAGKSTMVKMLSGLLKPDAGEIRVFGQDCRLASPRDAHRLGLQTAFQEMTQVRDLTVAQNMLLPYEPMGWWGTVRRRVAEQTVKSHLESLGLGAIDPRDEVRDLDLPLRQKIEIARAVLRRPRILLLDEPTSTLSGRDIDWLGDLIARLKAEGTTIVFISHRMPEVRRFCDSLTVLRNGKDIGTSKVDEISDDEVIRMIIGRSLASTFPPREAPQKVSTVPALAAHRLKTASRLTDGSFVLAKGEVLGIAGLQGMGQLELFLACFGMARLQSGRIEVEGRPLSLVSPKDAVRANIGISLVPEDRKTEALFLKLDGLRNVSLPIIDRFTRFGFIDTAAEREAVGQVLDRVQVQPRALFTRISAFSGGNQQKVAIGKWLLAESRTLLMYDPTRGVDVGTKHELYVLIRDFAKAGGAVLFYSTEIAELVNLCDRVLVMYGGRMVRELAGDEISEEAIMRAALGDAQGRNGQGAAAEADTGPRPVAAGSLH
ncbi:ABC transporter [Hypericibacter adhaerens]|jgi:ribose transport system ATP-binding protein|uniref:ABC transporter n=1 Tax=Hypericibacter adhaerens TaxID=2602016 RepID=A0A5J6N440_9PROT|nr:sugar ABC transporter ATP-binding protein [Hypericibacter adhaerens]QEX24184.1 ABC transporter [Hypericibacter adhaerens]